jgi:hypothetical protein
MHCDIHVACVCLPAPHIARPCSARIVGGTQVKLPVLHALLTSPAVGMTVDLEEVECIVANLVFRRLIRGYVSHKPPVLVVAKTNAFPPFQESAAAGGSG